MATSADDDPRSARRAAFETDGLVRVPGAVARADVDAMRDAIWTTLGAHGIARGDRRTWSAGGAMRLLELAGALRPGPGTEALLWEIGRAAAFAPLPAALARTVDDVLGAGCWEPVADQHGGLAAPNFPIAGARWSVPHAAWHVDEPTAPAQPRGWGLLGFVILDDLEPAGGATVAIAGSHRRLGQLADARAQPGAVSLVTTDDAVAALARDEPWFAALFRPGDADERRRRFVDEDYVSRGVPLRVVELTGQAGDVVLMDPRCLHTISANVSQRARLTMRMTCARAG